MPGDPLIQCIRNLVVEASLCTGLYAILLLLFGANLVVFMRKSQRPHDLPLMVFMLVLTYAIATLQYILEIWTVADRMPSLEDTRAIPVACPGAIPRVRDASLGALVSQCFCTNTFLIYRTWLIWDKNYWSIIVQVVFNVSIPVFVWKWARPGIDLEIPGVVIPAFFSLVSLTCTGLIIFRFVRVHYKTIAARQGMRRLGVYYLVQAGMAETLSFTTGFLIRIQDKSGLLFYFVPTISVAIATYILFLQLILTKAYLNSDVARASPLDPEAQAQSSEHEESGEIRISNPTSDPVLDLMLVVPHRSIGL